MPFEPISQGNIAIAILVGSGIWVWRALTIARGIGELTTEVKNLRGEVKYIREKLDGHIERQNGGV